MITSQFVLHVGITWCEMLLMFLNCIRGKVNIILETILRTSLLKAYLNQFRLRSHTSIFLFECTKVYYCMVFVMRHAKANYFYTTNIWDGSEHGKTNDFYATNIYDCSSWRTAGISLDLFLFSNRNPFSN